MVGIDPEYPRPRDDSSPESTTSADDAPTLIAYRLHMGTPLRLVPAPRERAWIEATQDRFASRCLPLLMANQAGWFLLNSHPLRVTWNGQAGKDALTLDYLAGAPPYPATSHFGHGILTWHIPYLFRTPPGWNLLARGPANRPKDGACPLEGLVETDWALATFTMNWRLTAIDRPVIFEPDEPVCMLVPQRRGELEAFHPEVRDLAADPETADAFRAWLASRSRFLADLHVPGSEAAKHAWQKDYVRGTSPGGTTAPAHQTKLRLREFTGPAGWPPRTPLVQTAKTDPWRTVVRSGRSPATDG